MHLERLVKSLAPGAGETSSFGATPGSDLSSRPGPASEASRVNAPDSLPVDTAIDERSDCGSMRVSASELRYVGGDHWAAILDSIADLKDHFDREEDLRMANSPDPTQDDNDDPSLGPRSPHALLLYSYRCRRATSRHEILAALPPRAVVDRYISRYFNRLDLTASCQCIFSSYIPCGTIANRFS